MADRSPFGTEPPESWSVGSDGPGGSISEDDVRRVEQDLTGSAGLLPPGREPPEPSDDAQRREVDRLLVERLAQEGFGGPQFERDYQKLIESLTGYAWPIITKLLRTGEIYILCQKVGRPVHRITGIELTSDDRKDLATDAVLAGETLFLDYGMRKGGWRPEGGLSLRAYFVNGCIRSFARVYARWWQDRRAAEQLLLRDPEHPDGLVLAVPIALSPDAAAVLQDEVAGAIRPVADRELRNFLGYYAIGYSQREAAGFVGLSEKAAANRLARLRARQQAQRRPTSPEGPQDAGYGRGIG